MVIAGSSRRTASVGNTGEKYLRGGFQGEGGLERKWGSALEDWENGGVGASASSVQL